MQCLVGFLQVGRIIALGHDLINQLLCQLSYAPTAEGTAWTNFNYSIHMTLIFRFGRLLVRCKSLRNFFFTAGYCFIRRNPMLRKLYALPTLLAGIALSTAIAQTPATP